jgi:plasmid stability protein
MFLICTIIGQIRAFRLFGPAFDADDLDPEGTEPPAAGAENIPEGRISLSRRDRLYAVIAAVDSIGGFPMATLTVRNLDDDIVRRLRIRAAEHGRSAEAEHRALLREALVGNEAPPAHVRAAERLAEFRRRTAGRGSSPASELLEQSRAARLETLTGTATGTGEAG